MNALKAAGEQSGGPLARGNRLVLAAFAEGGQDDKARQIFGFGAQAIDNPGAHAGATGDLRAGIHEHMSRVMIDRFGGHRADRSEEHTSELQSQSNLVCRLLLEKKKTL